MFKVWQKPSYYLYCYIFNPLSRMFKLWAKTILLLLVLCIWNLLFLVQYVASYEQKQPITNPPTPPPPPTPFLSLSHSFPQAMNSCQEIS